MTACATADSTANATAPFAFDTLPVRISVDENGSPWFAAMDVFAALGISWRGRPALQTIPSAWQGVRSFRTPCGDAGHGGGKQRLIVISEPAVYKLAFRSNKPEADRFTNWVASEVIPALRRDGAYAMPRPLVPAIPEEASAPRDADMEARLRHLRALKHEMLETTGEIYRAARRAMRQDFRHRDNSTILFLGNMNNALDYVLDALDRNLDALEYTSKSYVSAAKLFF